MYRRTDTFLREIEICQLTTTTERIRFLKFTVTQSGKPELVNLTFTKQEAKEKLEELFDRGIILKSRREFLFQDVNKSDLPETLSRRERDYYKQLVSDSGEHEPKEESVPFAV